MERSSHGGDHLCDVLFAVKLGQVSPLLPSSLQITHSTQGTSGVKQNVPKHGGNKMREGGARRPERDHVGDTCKDTLMGGRGGTGPGVPRLPSDLWLWQTSPMLLPEDSGPLSPSKEMGLPAILLEEGTITRG